jgi:hypothetical protein
VHVLRQLLHRLPGDADQRPENDGDLDLGRRQGLQRAHEPMFSKLAIPFLPNNPPRWPEVVDAVKKIVDVYGRRTPASTSAWASGSSASAGRASSS